ncbi:Fatty acyl-CoA reductase 8, partial [Mucuna pruriens]
FVEKILRVQPDIKKLYLLLRAPNSDLATHRLHNEVAKHLIKVIMKDLFRVLRDKWGADFSSFISKKVVAVAGDVSLENLGIKDENMMRSQILEEIDIIVHTAATTNFNER